MAILESTSEAYAGRRLRVGMAGLGVAAAETVRVLSQTPYVDLLAAADTRSQAVEAFKQRTGGRAYHTVEQLCEDPDVELIWIATPNKFHCDHAIMAARHGKHVSVEKPMATSLDEAKRMIVAAEENHVHLVCGRTKSTSAPMQAMREVITSSQLGKLQAIQVFAYTDWMLYPRLPDEVNLSLGGGVVYRQAPHQLDTIRLLGGGMVRSVRANIGQWMPERPAPGYYSAFLEFEDGTPATVVYNGYGYFQATDLLPWVPRSRDDQQTAQVRQALRSGSFDDVTAKEALRFAGSHEGTASPLSRRAGYNRDVGIVIVNCERGDIRQSPAGLFIYDDQGQHNIEVAAGPDGGLTEINEIYEAITANKPVRQDGRWGMATLELILAIIESGQERREVMLSHQWPAYK